MVTLDALGKALRQLREGKRLTLDDWEDLAGMDKGNLSKLERGQGGYSHESVGRLADALGTPVSQIYALAEAVQNGTATPDTVRLVTTMESLPDHPRRAIQAVIDTVAESTARWDGLERRRETTRE